MQNDLLENEIIEDINIALELLKYKKVLYSSTLGNKSFFVLKKGKILVLGNNSTYSLSFDEFIDLYQNNKFVIYEEKDDTIDIERDNEYYSWKHK